MSISLATKGIVFVSAPKETPLPDPSSMNGIITRGFGRFGVTVVEYHVVSVCEPDVVSHEYGKKNVVGKELKPIMTAEKPPRVCKEEGEE